MVVLAFFSKSWDFCCCCTEISLSLFLVSIYLASAE